MAHIKFSKHKTIKKKVLFLYNVLIYISCVNKKQVSKQVLN